MHHIADANEFHIWKDVHMPLPCILYAPGQGWSFFMSSKFHHGTLALDGYVLNHGRVNRVADPSFPKGEQHIDGVCHEARMVLDAKGAETEKDFYFVCLDGKPYQLDPPSTLDGGVLGGGLTSFYDFSITKNVFAMILASILLILVFSAVRKGYARNEGKAPSGIQSFFEPFFLFCQG